MWISVRWCRVGPFRVRLCLPGSVCKVEAARPWWNKVLRPFLHFAIACSGDGDGVVRLELAGSGDRVGAPVPVSSCTGVCSSMFQPCMVWGSAEFYRGLAVGLLGVWWLVRFLFPASRRQKRWIHGGRSLGVCPQPMCFRDSILLRLVQKPSCDGAPSYLGFEVLVVFTLLCRWPWRCPRAASDDFGKHKRSSGLVCIFLFLQGLLCMMVWTAVPSVLFE